MGLSVRGSVPGSLGFHVIKGLSLTRGDGQLEVIILLLW